MENIGLYYLQTNVLCILCLFVIYISVRNRNPTHPARRVAFNKMLLIIGIVCASDVSAWYFGGQMFEGARILIQISNIIYFGAITWVGFAWLNYAELRIRSLDYNYKKRRILTAIPLAVMLVLLLTNPLTNFMFSINEANEYVRGPGVIVHWIISWFYLVYATVEILIKIRRSPTRVEKSQFYPMLWFIVPPAVAAAVQMIAYGVTTTQCGMMLGAMIIAVDFMANEVSKDSLTGLNNRKTLEMTVIERLQHTSTEYTVFMCDVDHFKTINDTLGHTAGDLVLRRVSEALKRACGSFEKNLFLCRYGGDEFVIYGMNLAKEDAADLIAKLESSVASVNEEYGNELSFGISVGEATEVCSNYEEFEALISMADSIMYERKEAKKVKRK